MYVSLLCHVPGGTCTKWVGTINNEFLVHAISPLKLQHHTQSGLWSSVLRGDLFSLPPMWGVGKRPCHPFPQDKFLFHLSSEFECSLGRGCSGCMGKISFRFSTSRQVLGLVSQPLAPSFPCKVKP